MRYEWIGNNPIKLVRSSSKRVAALDILTPVEIRAILGELAAPARTITMLAAVTGMSVVNSSVYGGKTLISSGALSASFAVCWPHLLYF